MGEASHPNIKYPLILKTPPGVHYLKGDRGLAIYRGKGLESTSALSPHGCQIAMGSYLIPKTNG